MKQMAHEVGCIMMLLNVVMRLMGHKDGGIEHESKIAEVTRLIQGEVIAEMLTEDMILMAVQLECIKTN
jgi:hypothetical protein